MEADISALTYPNKRQAVCYPASTGGGAEGGDRGARKSEKREKGGVGDRNEGRVPTIIFPSLPQAHRGQTPVSIRG